MTVERRAVLARVRATTIEAFADMWRRYERVLFVDVPDHPNVGDNLIFQGELAMARHLGLDVAPVAHSFHTYNADAVRRVLTPGTALTIHGGGNLGGLYPHHQALRMQVTRDFPEREIVQAPQSIYFASAEDELETRAWMQQPNLRLVVRDGESFELASQSRPDVRLAPDAVHALLLPEPALPGIGRRVVLAREDEEATQSNRAGAADWPQVPPPRVTRILDRGAGHLPGLLRYRTALSRWERETARRGQIGVDFLSGYDIVETDRLHAVLVGLLLGLDVVSVPSRTGKVRSYIATWLDGIEGLAVSPR